MINPADVTKAQWVPGVGRPGQLRDVSAARPFSRRVADGI